jgi:bifunctional non-homologous end joining protein LigD
VSSRSSALREGTAELLGRRFEVTSTDRVIFPDIGLTKGGFIDHQRRIAEVAFPHLEGRPVAMKRYPEGLEGEGFFQKRAEPHLPDWIERVDIPKREGGSLEHVVVNEPAVLPYLANQGVLELHPWLSTADDLEHPDQLVFDLDPPEDDVDAARDASRRVGDVLEELGLSTRLKTSGSAGYHVHVLLDRSEDADTARVFAADVAKLLSRRHPDTLTDQARRAARRGRVLVDYLRNGYGQTVVAPYSVRARPGAPIATPIAWDELGEVDPQRYTVGNIFRRLAQLDGDPWVSDQVRPVGLADARDRLDAALAE